MQTAVKQMIHFDSGGGPPALQLRIGRAGPARAGEPRLGVKTTTMTFTTRLRSAAFALMAVALPARGQTVVDGNTIVLEGRHVRLWGIQAPDLHATCSGWPAGEIAAAFLHDLINNRSIACTARGLDVNGKLFGMCRSAGVDVGATMVRKGLAWAAVTYTRDYVELEAAAKADNLAIHAHHCPPLSSDKAEGK